jgi:hypothetical protein
VQQERNQTNQQILTLLFCKIFSYFFSEELIKNIETFKQMYIMLDFFSNFLVASLALGQKFVALHIVAIGKWLSYPSLVLGGGS